MLFLSTETPVTLEWVDDAQTILKLKLTGRWKWSDLLPSLVEIRRNHEDSDRLFDLIIDVSQSKLYESNPIGFMREYMLPSYGVSALRLIVVVGVDNFARVLWSGITALPIARHLRAYFFDTLDEAIQFCQRYTGIQTNE